jgi:hypothetical protein
VVVERLPLWELAIVILLDEVGTQQTRVRIPNGEKIPDLSWLLPKA